MKLIPVNYYGFTTMDRRFSSPMLPWIVSEIRKRDFVEKVSRNFEQKHFNPLLSLFSYSNIPNFSMSKVIIINSFLEYLLFHVNLVTNEPCRIIVVN